MSLTPQIHNLDPDASEFNHWQAAQRIPILFSDGPSLWRFLEAMWLQKRISFHYWGGSFPGELRTVVPRRIFRVEGFPHIYIVGWSSEREAERTFRFDRLELLEE